MPCPPRYALKFQTTLPRLAATTRSYKTHVFFSLKLIIFFYVCVISAIDRLTIIDIYRVPKRTRDPRGIWCYVRIDNRSLRYFFYTLSVSYYNICSLFPTLHQHSLLWLPIQLLSIRVYPETYDVCLWSRHSKGRGAEPRVRRSDLRFTYKKNGLGRKRRKQIIFKTEDWEKGGSLLGTYAVGGFYRS